VLRDEDAPEIEQSSRRAQNVPKSGTRYSQSRRLAVTTSVTHNETSLITGPLGASSKLVMRVRFSSSAPLHRSWSGHLNVAELFEQADDKNDQAGHAHSMIVGAQAIKVPVRGYFWPLIRALV
jgi:hypothetical protein